jgi:hypothetical protein
MNVAIRTVSTVVASLLLTMPARSAPAQGEGAPSSHRASHERMLSALRDILARTDDENWLLGDTRVREYAEKLAKLPPGAPSAVRFQVLVALGDALVYYGREREGLARFAEAFQLDSAGIPEGEYRTAMMKHASAGCGWRRP